jgi:hypothetical protein
MRYITFKVAPPPCTSFLCGIISEKNLFCHLLTLQANHLQHPQTSFTNHHENMKYKNASTQNISMERINIFNNMHKICHLKSAGPSGLDLFHVWEETSSIMSQQLELTIHNFSKTGIILTEDRVSISNLSSDTPSCRL